LVVSSPQFPSSIDSFHAKLVLVQKDFPSAIGTIVSASTFTDAIRSHASSAGIHLVLFRDLSAQLFDGHSYANGLIRELTSNKRYPMAVYVEPFIDYDADTHGNLADQMISEWLDTPEWRQLTILGDVGTGKSFLARRIAFRLAEAFLKEPLHKPLPILIDLRNADRQFSLEGLILTHLATSGLAQVSFDVFQYALLQGQLVLILDGFDEMASRVTPQVTTRNFHELARCVQGQGKILLTCRTHYFKSRTEEEDVILGGSLGEKSENVRELYWDLISRKGFKIAYLRPFAIQQIEQYVKLVQPTATREAMAKIHQTYNLMELSQRPMLLEMIVKSLDKLGDSEINPATLYRVFTSAWIHRDQWRDVLSPNDKTAFLIGLARKLWQEEVDIIHHASLMDCIRNDLAARISNQQELAEVDNEIRTASFLTRNDAGFYGFAHKSYQEYFYAQFLAEQLNKGRVECLYTRRLSPEIITFLGHMIKNEPIERALEEILITSYRPMISENALATLYGIRKNLLLSNARIGSRLIVPLPRGCHLEGAQLEQITLEGASLVRANFSNANLSEAMLANGNFSGCSFTAANLVNTNLVGASVRSADLRHTVLREANLERADVSSSVLDGADLTEAQLIGLRHDAVDFRSVILTGAILPEELATKLPPAAHDKISSIAGIGRTVQLAELWNKLSLIRLYLKGTVQTKFLPASVDAEDVVDDSILRVMLSKKELENIKDFELTTLKSYMRLVVRRTAYNLMDRNQKFIYIDDGHDEGLLNDGKDELLYWWDESVPEYVNIDEIDTWNPDAATADQKLLLAEMMEMVNREFSPPALEVFRYFSRA
jgi:DNA-directed RNA polymerase specialized sigma24 family protein